MERMQRSTDISDIGKCLRIKPECNWKGMSWRNEYIRSNQALPNNICVSDTVKCS